MPPAVKIPKWSKERIREVLEAIPASIRQAICDLIYASQISKWKAWHHREVLEALKRIEHFTLDRNPIEEDQIGEIYLALKEARNRTDIGKIDGLDTNTGLTWDAELKNRPRNIKKLCSDLEKGEAPPKTPEERKTRYLSEPPNPFGRETEPERHAREERESLLHSS